MISRLLNIIENGFLKMRENRQLLFVGFLVFVFPVIFLYTAQAFLDASYTNIQTSEKQRVGILHDVITALADTATEPDVNLVNELLLKIKSDNADITEIRLLKKVPEGFLIIASLDKNIVGNLEVETGVFITTPQSNAQSFIYEFSKENVRTWQAIRHIKRADDAEYFIFSEHTFARLDKTIASRKLVAYAALAVIFLFLIALAYWLVRQIDWQSRYIVLRNTLDERDLFTNMIAHEFRTPLTAIKGYGSLLEDSTTLQITERDYLSKMLTSSDRLLALVNDFLEVARLQSGRMKMDIEEVDIKELCTEVVGTLAPLAREQGLELSFSKPEEPIAVKTDRKRLYQVIQNLLSNAIKYTERGSISLALEVSSISLAIKIMDTGMGISAEDQQKLFAPFARVGGVEKSSVSGTGLGMWISKQYVELLGGKISVESIKDVGTHVIVTLKR